MIDSIFDDFLDTKTIKNKPEMRTDVIEAEDKYLFDIEIPGFTKDDIKISLEDGYLTVEANKAENPEENPTYIRKERFLGNISRSYYVGYNINDEKINAAYNSGVLTITVFKTSKEENKKYINIE